MPDLTTIAYLAVKLRDSPDVLTTIADFNNLEAAGLTAILLALIITVVKVLKWLKRLFW